MALESEVPGLLVGPGVAASGVAADGPMVTVSVVRLRHRAASFCD